MSSEESKGASYNELLLAAARADNEDLLLDVFQAHEGAFDINFADGLGNTALHLAVSHGSTDVIEYILSHDDCDVDPINRLQKATPLHLAVLLQPPELRHYLVSSLLEAGADASIKDKYGETPIDLIPSDDKKLQEIFRQYQAQASISRDDIASDNEDDGESGSESE